MTQKELAARQSSMADQKEREYKQVLAERAYQKWVANKMEEEEQRRKEMKVNREIRILNEEQRKAKVLEVQASYSSWKRRKEMEEALEQEIQRTDTFDGVEQRKTPTLAGYCSVWSCDEELADQMFAKVPREATFHHHAMRH